MRKKYLNEKKDEIQKNVPTTIDQSHKMDNKSKVRKGTAMFASNNDYD